MGNFPISLQQNLSPHSDRSLLGTSEGAWITMTDFVQSNVTKSRFFELADLNANVTTFEHKFQIISFPPHFSHAPST